MVRAEITGQKPRVTADRAKRRPGSLSTAAEALDPTPHHDPHSSVTTKTISIQGPPTPTAAYSIREFCLAHRVSVSMYFKLRNEGLGPVEMSIGRRRLISFEAAEAWRRERERRTATTSTAAK